MSWVSPDDSPDGLAGALETRAELLATLVDEPRKKRALREELGVARSTVYKGLRELAALGLTLFDEEAAALTTCEEGGVSGILLSDAPQAYAWADETYEAYREQGEKL